MAQAILDLDVDRSSSRCRTSVDGSSSIRSSTQRTDSFADLGAMYATQPGFYPARRAGLEGRRSEGHRQVFRSPTNIGFIDPPRVSATIREDRQAVHPLVRQIMMLPVSELDGTMKNV